MSEKREGSAYVAVSLREHGDVSALLSTIKGGMGESADSVRVSLRGSRSAVVNMLDRFGDSVAHVSAAISLRGDKLAE